MSKATVQGCQIQYSITQTAPIAFISVALSFSTRENEAVEIVEETVSGDVNILHSHAVQVAEVMLSTQTENVIYIKKEVY